MNNKNCNCKKKYAYQPPINKHNRYIQEPFDNNIPIYHNQEKTFDNNIPMHNNQEKTFDNNSALYPDQYIEDIPQMRINRYQNEPFDNIPQNKCNCKRTNFEYSDKMLLDYLLDKYNIDKNKLIQSMHKMDEMRDKYNIISDFYESHEYLIDKSISEQYHYFKRWNTSNIYISKNELLNYYEKYIIE